MAIEKYLKLEEQMFAQPTLGLIKRVVALAGKVFSNHAFPESVLRATQIVDFEIAPCGDDEDYFVIFGLDSRGVRIARVGGQCLAG